MKDQVTVSAADRVFMQHCVEMLAGIKLKQHSRLEQVARELTWGDDIPPLTHPHVRGVAYLLWDIAEGCYFDINSQARWKKDFQVLQRSVRDFNEGKIYPAEYILHSVATQKKGDKWLESFGFFATCSNDGKIVVHCANPNLKQAVEALIPKTAASDSPKTNLEKLQNRLPKELAGLTIQKPAFGAYLVESYANLGI